MTTPATTGERDPELFCACGHHLTEHGPTPTGTRCLATQPEPVCSCAGWRLATRSAATGG